MACQRIWLNPKRCLTNVFSVHLQYIIDPKDGFDFKLDEFFAAPSETFEPYYGKLF